MLDAGLSLDERRRAIVSRLSQSSPSGWRADDVQTLKEGMEASATAIPLKRLYGSEYPFSTAGVPWKIDRGTTEVRPSFAKGGLSTVWGAGILPFSPSDLADWPIHPGALEPHYRQVFSFLPCAAVRDDLEEMYPIFSETPEELEPSRQIQAFLHDARRARTRLRACGIIIGRSRLAVAATSGMRPCACCGLCLYGCPYELIYSSEFTLRQLQSCPTFRYVPNFVVERLREDHGEVTVLGYDRLTGQATEARAGRVLVGAGVIPSTKILLHSLDEFEVEVRIQDSLYFLMPLVRLRATPGLESENLHTMAQAFIAIRNAKLCDFVIHLSVYTYNDLMLPSLKAAAGPLGRHANWLWRELAARMLVCGGYLHSRLSPGIRMRLSKTGGRTGIHLKAEEDPRPRAIVKRAATTLLKKAGSLRCVPLVPMIKYSQPGRGFHCGGSFPMRHTRTPHTSDIEGRPYGFERVHLVDASCFPSIPASTITLGVMANAHRIATLAAARGA
jgi:ferredoxin